MVTTSLNNEIDYSFNKLVYVFVDDPHLGMLAIRPLSILVLVKTGCCTVSIIIVIIINIA